MEEFKKAIKQAIIEKAEAIRFEENQYPQLMQFTSESPLLQLSSQTRAEIVDLIEKLMPNQNLANNSIREGSLSIVNFGELRLLASFETSVRLFVFIPPQGLQMFQQIRNQLLVPTTKLPPKPIELNTLTAVSNHDRREQGQFSTIGATEQIMARVPDEIPLAGSTEPQLSQFETPWMTSPAKPNTIPDLAHDMLAAGLWTQGKPAHPNPIQETQLVENMNTGLAAVSQDSYLSQLPPLPLTSRHEAPPAESFSYGEESQYQAEQTQAYGQTIKPLLPAHHGLLSPVQPQTPAPSHAANSIPSASPIIHFGPDIPGESIDRSQPRPIDQILIDMVKRKASDVHLTLGQPVCLRIDGEIVRLTGSPISEAEMRTYLLPIMPPNNQLEFAAQSDTDFAYEITGVARFRVNIFRDRLGVGAVLRQIPDRVLSADELNLPPAVRNFAELHKGLVIVTGPTGSGKSTTLAAIIDLINSNRTDHILTIEDPIEFVHSQKRCLINQREVFRHTKSFSRALKAALREDPDIVLIGELRDLETTAIAIETAETGHLVFATLHTNTAISTIDRLIDQFPSDQQEQVRVMLSESLKGVVAQNLLKKKGGGRIAAQEILVIDKALSSMIREGNSHMIASHMQTQKSRGNCSLNDSLLALVIKGIVEAKDAHSKAIEKDAFASLLQQKGIPLDPTVKSA